MISCLNCINSGCCRHYIVTLTKEEYFIIKPLLKKWDDLSNIDKSYMDQQIFLEFRKDLDFFSTENENWFENNFDIRNWFEQTIWLAFFAKYESRATSLCDILKRLIEERASKHETVIITDFALIDPYEFEHLIGDLFKSKGYKSTVTQGSGDYGIDVVARKGNEVLAIQAKKYSPGNNVGNREVQMLLGAMQFRKVEASKAILITSSDFTKQAVEQAKGAPIELWNGVRLKEEINKFME